MEATRNLCAQIPASLHAKVRQEQEQMGQTLSEYVEQILNEHFEGGKTMAGTKTLAFQVPEELFQRLKAHLAKEGISQKQFVVSLIEQALNAAKTTDQP
jgi:predicted HicB family RNase H-like nuclease